MPRAAAFPPTPTPALALAVAFALALAPALAHAHAHAERALDALRPAPTARSMTGLAA